VGAPKRSISCGLGDAAVFHRVVHQRGHHGLRIEPPVGHQAGHRDGVGDVGLAAGAELAQVRLVGELVGVAHLLQVGLGQVGSLSVSAANDDASTGRQGCCGNAMRPRPCKGAGQQFGSQ
jgi:hypothetical protein